MKKVISIILIAAIWLSSINIIAAEVYDILEVVPLSMPGASVDVPVDIGLSTDGTYHENVLKENGLLTAEVTAKNNTGSPLNLTSILAFYNAYGKLVDLKTNTVPIAVGITGYLPVTNYTALVPTGGYAKVMLCDISTVRPYSDTITLNATEADFYGNSFETSTLINNINRPIQGELNSVGDVDYISFVPKKSGTYTLSSDSSLNMEGYIYDNNQQFVASCTTGGDFSITANLTAGQIYYLKINGTGTATGSYTVSINYDLITLISANSTITGYLNTEYQIDWYRILESSSGLLTLTLSDIPNDCDYRVAICDTTGNVIMDDTASGVNRKIEDFSILKNEDYYIIVYSSAGSSNIQAYTLVSSYTAVADKEPDDKEVIGSPQGASMQTDNMSASAAQLAVMSQNASSGEMSLMATGTAVTISVNSSVMQSGMISSSGGMTFYNTTLSSGDKLTADLMSPIGKTYLVCIADSNLSLLAVWAVPDSRSFASWKAASSGTYHIIVWDYYETGASSQNYSLRLTRYNSSNYDSWEVNDSLEQADTKSTSFNNNELGSPTKKVNGISNLSIDTSVDQDRFPVYLNAGDKLTVDTEIGSGYVDATYKYRIGIGWVSGGTFWEWKYTNPDSYYGGKATYIAPASRQYYVNVFSENSTNGSPSIKYKLTVTKVAASNVSIYEASSSDAEMSNDFINSARDITSSTQIVTTLDNQLDTDWYRIYDTTSARTKTITLTNCDANTQMELFENKYGILRYIPQEANAKRIVVNIDKNTEYLLWVGSTNWNPSNKNYTLSLTNTQNPDSLGLTSNPTYNGGQGAKLGAGNTLSFNMKKQTTGTKSYWIEAAASWDADGDIWGKSESGKSETFSGTTAKTVTLDNITISGGGTSLQTYIRAYASQTNRTLIFASPPFQGTITGVMPQEVTINQNPHSMPYRYIFVDHPEHIRTIDTLENQSILMHVNYLEPGYRYVLAEYHHKSISSSFGDYPFSPSTALYYDAAFCGNEGESVTISKIGYSHQNWNYLNNAYTDFLGIVPKGNWYSPHSYNVGTRWFPAPVNGDSKGIVWFSDMINSSDANKMLISNTSDMGFVHVLVEFEVSAPTALRTMAYTNNQNYKTNFSSNMQSTFEDLPLVVSKGTGNFAQTVEVGELEYYIDDNLFTNGTINLPFKVNNRLFDNSATNTLYTNSVPTFYDARTNMPDSGVFSTTFTGGLNIGGSITQGSMIFDGYHNAKIGSVSIPGVYTLGQNEAYPQLLLNWIKNSMDNPFGQNPSAAALQMQKLSEWSTMAGYDVTHKYRIKIHNTGSQTRYLKYHVVGAGYVVKFGGNTLYTEDSNFAQELNKVSVTLPPNSVIVAEIETALLMGGNATAKHQLTVY